MPKVPTGLNSFQRPKTNILPSATIQPARVKLSILDDKTNPELFKKYGEWDSIGCIFFEFLDHPTKNILNNIAFPLYPNQSTIPLQNEIVYLIVMPNNGFGNNPKDVSYYYFQPLNIWNSVHHNAVPDPNINSSIPESQKQYFL